MLWYPALRGRDVMVFCTQNLRCDGHLHSECCATDTVLVATVSLIGLLFFRTVTLMSPPLIKTLAVLALTDLLHLSLLSNTLTRCAFSDWRLLSFTVTTIVTSSH